MSDIFRKSNVYIMDDALLDLDLGLILTMKDKFLDSEYIERDIYKYNIDQMKRILLHRKYDNPLCVIMRDYSDELYHELYNEYREEIYNNSIYTNIINMLITVKKLDNISITVLCKNIQDKHLISALYNEYIGTYKINILDDIEFKDDDNIFINKTSFIPGINDIRGVNLYLSKSMYNLKYNESYNIHELRSHISALGEYNNIKIFSPYN